MNDHGKKMIAPVVITILFLLYLAFYGAMVIMTAVAVPFMIFLAVPLVALGIGMVYVLAARIKEIRSGEEDDLDNY